MVKRLEPNDGDIGGRNKGDNMGVTSDVSKKASKVEKFGDAKVLKTKYEAENEIFPCGDGKEKNPKMETGMFGDDALKSGIPADGKYAGKASQKAAARGMEGDKMKFDGKPTIWPMKAGPSKVN